MEQLLPVARPLAAEDLLDLYDPPAPSLRAGMLVSLDGATSYAGRSGPLQPPGDLEVFRALRAVSDAVLVGAGTARTEGYGPVRLRPHARAWRARHGRAAEVPLVLVTRTLDLPADARWWAGPVLVVTCAAAPTTALPDEVLPDAARPAEVLVCGDERVDLGAALRALAARGLSRVLCEGGPALLGDLAAAGLLTEVCATVAPVLAGAADGMLAAALPAPVPLQLAHLLVEQGALLGRWRVVPQPATGSGGADGSSTTSATTPPSTSRSGAGLS